MLLAVEHDFQAVTSFRPDAALRGNADDRDARGNGNAAGGNGDDDLRR